MKIKLYLKLIKRLLSTNSNLNIVKKELIRKFYTHTDKTDKIRKGIVMSFDGHILHGGLVDRLRGIVSVYSWCKKRGIPFYINYVSPMELDNWLKPNVVSWKLSKEEISYDKKHALPYDMTGWLNLGELHAMLGLLCALHPQKQLHIYANCQPDKNEFNTLFNELFKIDSTLLDNLNNIQANLFSDKPYIGLSFRFNQLLGDFKDTIGEPLEEHQQELLMKKCISKVKYLHDVKCPHSQLLITADSNKFLKRIDEELSYVMIIPGKSVHMDQMKGESKEAYTKVFIDILMLSRAEKVYLLKTDKMYRGAFGEYASLIGGIPYEVIEF